MFSPPVIKGIMVGNNFIQVIDKKVELDANYGVVQNKYFNFTIIAYDDDIEVDGDEMLKYYVNQTQDLMNFVLDKRSGEAVFLPKNCDVGIYIVNILVVDQSALSDEVVIEIHIADANELPPKPKLEISTLFEESLTINVNLLDSKNETVSESNPLMDPDGDPLTCIWEFGDGFILAVKQDSSYKWTAEYTYKHPGTYDVKLIIHDDRGGAVIVNETITIGIKDDDDNNNDYKPEISEGTEKQEKQDTDYPNLNLVISALTILLIIVAVFFIALNRKILFKKVEENIPEPETPDQDTVEGQEEAVGPEQLSADDTTTPVVQDQLSVSTVLPVQEPGLEQASQPQIQQPEQSEQPQHQQPQPVQQQAVQPQPQDDYPQQNQN